MSVVEAISAVLGGPPVITEMTGPAMAPIAGPTTANTPGFADMLSNGVQQIERKLDTADAMVRRVALGEDLPIHQVTYALEQARLSVELAMQVRSRMLDGYREIMNLQL